MPRLPAMAAPLLCALLGACVPEPPPILLALPAPGEPVPAGGIVSPGAGVPMVILPPSRTTTAPPPAVVVKVPEGSPMPIVVQPVAAMPPPGPTVAVPTTVVPLPVTPVVTVPAVVSTPALIASSVTFVEPRRSPPPPAMPTVSGAPVTVVEPGPGAPVTVVEPGGRASVTIVEPGGRATMTRAAPPAPMAGADLPPIAGN